MTESDSQGITSAAKTMYATRCHTDSIYLTCVLARLLREGILERSCFLVTDDCRTRDNRVRILQEKADMPRPSQRVHPFGFAHPCDLGGSESKSASTHSTDFISSLYSGNSQSWNLSLSSDVGPCCVPGSSCGHRGEEGEDPIYLSLSKAPTADERSVYIEVLLRYASCCPRCGHPRPPPSPRVFLLLHRGIPHAHPLTRCVHRIASQVVV